MQSIVTRFSEETAVCLFYKRFELLFIFIFISSLPGRKTANKQIQVKSDVMTLCKSKLCKRFTA